MAELITLKGWGSPFRIDPNTGGVRVSVSPLVLEESIQTVLGTLIQDRLFLKLFGSRLPTLITEGIIDEILDVAQHEIMLALSQFESRIDVREVKFFADELEGVIRVRLEWLIRATGQTQQLLI